MLDLDHLRRDHSVVTVGEYLKLNNMDEDREWLNGAWDRQGYHDVIPKPSLASIPNHEYDPSGVIRVDRVPPPPKERAEKMVISPVLMKNLDQNTLIMKLDDAKRTLEHNGLKIWESETELEGMLEKEDWVILHTFAGL